MVIDHGAVPIFVKLLGSLSDDVREQVRISTSRPLYVFMKEVSLISVRVLSGNQL